MSKERERQQRILELVRRKGFVSIDMVSLEIAADPETIRRDINDLFSSGKLESHGEGISWRSTVENLAYVTRQALNHEEKVRIARTVASHIPNHASLFINIGTTTEEVAKALMDHEGLHIITNNLHVANIMGRKSRFRSHFGGWNRPQPGSWNRLVRQPSISSASLLWISESSG